MKPLIPVVSQDAHQAVCIHGPKKDRKLFCVNRLRLKALVTLAPPRQVLRLDMHFFQFLICRIGAILEVMTSWLGAESYKITHHFTS